MPCDGSTLSSKTPCMLFSNWILIWAIPLSNTTWCLGIPRPVFSQAYPWATSLGITTASSHSTYFQNKLSRSMTYTNIGEIWGIYLSSKFLLVFFKDLFVFILCVWVLCLHVCLWLTSLQGLQRPDVLELEL